MLLTLCVPKELMFCKNAVVSNWKILFVVVVAVQYSCYDNSRSARSYIFIVILVEKIMPII